MPSCQECGCATCVHANVYTTSFATFCPEGITTQVYVVKELYTGMAAPPSVTQRPEVPLGFAQGVHTCHSCGPKPITTQLIYPADGCPFAGGQSGPAPAPGGMPGWVVSPDKGGPGFTPAQDGKGWIPAPPKPEGGAYWGGQSLPESWAGAQGWSNAGAGVIPAPGGGAGPAPGIGAGSAPGIGAGSAPGIGAGSAPGWSPAQGGVPGAIPAPSSGSGAVPGSSGPQGGAGAAPGQGPKGAQGGVAPAGVGGEAYVAPLSAPEKGPGKPMASIIHDDGTAHLTFYLFPLGAGPDKPPGPPTSNPDKPPQPQGPGAGGPGYPQVSAAFAPRIFSTLGLALGFYSAIILARVL